jgi:hypothetical protein
MEMVCLSTVQSLQKPGKKGRGKGMAMNGVMMGLASILILCMWIFMVKDRISTTES